MKIQDAERATGLDRATIRFYEKEGLVAPKREENGYRSYCDEDVSLLQKIKLLRQLSFSLDNIKKLQQGSIDFAATLSQQIEILSQQIENDTAAKEVCITMRHENVQYQSLDTTRYLNMLSTNNAASKPLFEEKVQRECHPWRRYFARSIDYAWVAGLISFIIVVVFRIRPFSTNALRAVQYLSYLVAMPIMALLQHCWGTTPGKWTMGIRLENINGEKLSFSNAMYREITVFCVGEGLRIPVISLWRLYKSYKNDTEGEGNSWNEETEIIYMDWNRIKKAAYGFLALLSLALSWSASMDTMLPKYRGAGITLSEFVRNYQDYEKVLDIQGEYVLAKDGCWDERELYGYHVIVSEDPNHIRPDFIYEFDNEGYLRSISYSDHWDDAQFSSPVPSYCTTALYALLGSRPGISYRDLVAAEELIISEIHDKLVDAAKQGSFTGDFQVNDIKVSWIINTENCDFVSDAGWMVSIGENEMPYFIKYKIEIIH